MTSPTWRPAQSAKVTEVSRTAPRSVCGGLFPAIASVANGPVSVTRQSPTAGALRPGGAMAVPATRSPPILATRSEQTSAAASTSTPATRRVTRSE